jgi:hypothetical protein
MKKQASPVVTAFAIVVAIAAVGCLYYLFLGRPPGKAAAASPYGFPTAEDFRRGVQHHSLGRNAITGETTGSDAGRAGSGASTHP